MRLGCSAEERATPQPVDLDLAVRFAELPAACESDKLEDTRLLRRADRGGARARAPGASSSWSSGSPTSSSARLRPLVPPGAELWLRATKLQPPVDGLAGGVAFSLGDFAGAPR